MDVLLLCVCMAMVLAGAIMGLFSGLVPGIHVNTLTAVLLVLYPVLQSSLSGLVDADGAAIAVSCCVVSASVVHSFVDFVPSVFIGAPDAEDAVSVLPGHRLLLEGRGMDAVRAAASGSLVGACCAVLLAIPLQIVMSTSIGGMTDDLAWTVAFIASSVIVLGCGTTWRERSWGLVAFCVSGVLGLMVGGLDIPSMGLFGEGTLLFPMLTGLFGIPILLSGCGSDDIPAQAPGQQDPTGMGPGLRGVLMGCIAGWFPGITSTVGASMSSCLFRETRPEDFIANVASIGTVTAVLSVVALSVSGSGRSGTAIVLRELSGDMLYGIASNAFLIILLAIAASALVGYWLTILSGSCMSRMVSRADMGLVNRAVIMLDCILVLALTGPYGLLILAISVVIGFLPVACGTSRIVLCGCLLMNVLIPII